MPQVAGSIPRGHKTHIFRAKNHVTFDFEPGGISSIKKLLFFGPRLKISTQRFVDDPMALRKTSTQPGQVPSVHHVIQWCLFCGLRQIIWWNYVTASSKVAMCTGDHHMIL